MKRDQGVTQNKKGCKCVTIFDPRGPLDAAAASAVSQRLIRLRFLPSVMVTLCIYSAVRFKAYRMTPSLLGFLLATRGLAAGDDATLATLLRQVSFLLGQYYVDGNIFAESGVHLNGR